ncbi:hypothetical protein PMIN06_006079 [Paraphaeosphaeria minitans]
MPMGDLSAPRLNIPPLWSPSSRCPAPEVGVVRVIVQVHGERHEVVGCVDDGGDEAKTVCAVANVGEEVGGRDVFGCGCREEGEDDSGTHHDGALYAQTIS